MAFKDLRDVVKARTITLPIGGVDYVIQDVDADTGLWAQAVFEAGVTVHSGTEITAEQAEAVLLDDDEEPETYARFLGDAYETMRADGVRWGDLKHAALTAMVWIVMGEDQAEEYWTTPPGEGQAAAPARPNRGSRRASAATARTTRKRASTTGIRASKPTTSKSAASRGGKSSSSGDS